jgi:hypothetical protein
VWQASAYYNERAQSFIDNLEMLFQGVFSLRRFFNYCF